MTHLLHVPVEDLSESHLTLIDRAAKVSYYGESTRHYFEEIARGDLLVFEVLDSEAEGVVLVRLIPRTFGTEFWIEHLTGKGFLKDAKGIWKACHEKAKELGALRVSGLALRPGLAKLYEEVLGAPPVATVHSQEVQ